MGNVEDWGCGVSRVNGTSKVGVYRDKDRWSVRWYGAINPKTETAKRHCESFRLKQDAQRFRAQLQADFSKGKQRDPPPKITLGDFCQLYQQRRHHEWQEKTRRGVNGTCQRLQRYFGKRCELSSITPERATEFWAAVRSLRSGKQGAELSRSSRNVILRYAKTLFEYAVRWGYLATNPFATVKALRVGKRDRKDWRFLKTNEYLQLLAASPDSRWKAFYALGYTTGARCGELLNLREQDVDCEQAMLLIRSRKGTWDVPSFQVKDHEHREIPIPKHTMSIVDEWLRVRPEGSPLILISPERYRRLLERWRRHQQQGLPWLNDYLANNLIRDLRIHARRAGIDDVDKLTIHALRKSCATNWAAHLPMHVVKELMGHSEISTTAEFYTVVDDSMADKARWVVDAVLGADTSRPELPMAVAKPRIRLSR